MINITPQIRGTIYTMLMVISLLYAGYSWGIEQYIIAIPFAFIGFWTYIRMMRANKELYYIENEQIPKV